MKLVNQQLGRFPDYVPVLFDPKQSACKSWQMQLNSARDTQLVRFTRQGRKLASFYPATLRLYFELEAILSDDH